MADAPDVEAVREAMAKATPGPWWFDEDDHCWRLHGVAFSYKPFPNMEQECVVNKQILKAPKHGTPYAEYWPDEADAKAIVTAVNSILPLCDAYEAARDRLQAVEAERDRLMEALTEVEDILLDICPYFTGDDKRRSQAFKIIDAALHPSREASGGE